MPEMVLLRHETPDGGFHYDWLIDPGGEAPLVSFRLRERLDEAEGEIAAERMADHRRVYLEYEGEISGERGRVRRVARGRWRRCEVGAERVTVEGELGAARGRFEARREGDRWAVRLERADGAA